MAYYTCKNPASQNLFVNHSNAVPNVLMVGRSPAGAQQAAFLLFLFFPSVSQMKLRIGLRVICLSTGKPVGVSPCRQKCSKSISFFVNVLLSPQEKPIVRDKDQIREIGS